jgi:hypothetical protein
VHLCVFDVAHALVVADGQCQERRDHRTPVGDIAVEQFDGVGELDQFPRFVSHIDERVNAACEVISRRNLHIRSCRRFGREMCGRFDIRAEPLFRLHVVSHEYVLTSTYQVRFLEVEVYVAVALVVCHVSVPV